MRTRASLASVLAATDLFGRLGPDDLAAIEAGAVDKRWVKGQTLFQRGDPGDGMLVVLEGRIRLSLLSPDGREITLRHAGPGEIVGEMSLLDGRSRSADATALTDVEGRFVPRAAFDRVIERRPALLRSITMVLCRRLRDTNELLESVAHMPIETRLARYFLREATTQAIGVADQVSLTLGMSQSELASAIGASRPKLNRVLSSWEDSGLVARQGRQVDFSLGALRRIANHRGD